MHIHKYSRESWAEDKNDRLIKHNLSGKMKQTVFGRFKKKRKNGKVMKKIIVLFNHEREIKKMSKLGVPEHGTMFLILWKTCSFQDWKNQKEEKKKEC